jgi:stage III sporulation protein AE
MKISKPLFAALAVLAALFLPPAVNAADAAETPDTELREEMERQLGEVDLSTWEEYSDSLEILGMGGISSIKELIISCAEGENGEAEGLFSILEELVRKELKRAAAYAAALTAAALVTVIPAVIADDGIKPVFALALCTVSVSLCAGVFASLGRIAYGTVSGAAKLIEASAPILSALLLALGQTASLSFLRPLMLFLSGTVVGIVEKAALPIACAGGVIVIVDSLTENERLKGMISLAKSAVKWILGLVSAFYVGIAALNGMTAASRDGVSVRTAKFALGRIVPIVGGMVGETVDSIMGCALLIKNGAGSVALILLAALTVRPLAVLAAGSLVFRAAAAVVSPFADARTVRLYSGLGEIAALLFACTAAVSALLMLTVLIFLASGGLAAGLW